MNRETIKSISQKTFLRIILLILFVIMLYPLLWTVMSSFKTSTEYLTDAYALPSSLHFENYAHALEGSNLLGTIWNTVYVIIITLIVVLVCSVPCSYALARYRFPGSKLLLGVLIGGLFVSSSYIVVQLFLELRELKLLNNLTALALIYATFQLPFSCFLLTNYMREIPRDYEEAAIIDGCSPFGVLWNVIIPMSKANILTVGMISVLVAWSEYNVALVLVADPSKHTFPVGLANLYAVQSYATDWGALFAGITIAMIPTIVLFIIGEKYVIKGMSVGGLKG